MSKVNVQCFYPYAEGVLLKEKYYNMSEANVQRITKEEMCMDENKNEELNNNSEVLDNEVRVEKKKSKWTIVAGILAILLGGIVFISFVFLVILFLSSPKHRFFNLVSSEFSNMSREVSSFEDSAFGKLLMLDTENKLALDVNMNGNIETEDAEIKEWVQNLESFELSVKENIDIPNSYSDAMADFTLNSEKFLTGALIQNKNIISAKIDDVTDGYITVNDDKLPELWEKIGYDGPASLTSQTELLKEISFSKSDINNLKSTLKAFGTGFSTAFEDEDFSFGEGTVHYDEGSIECKSMDFNVSAIKLNEGLIAGLEKVSNKEKHIDVLYKLISMLDKLSGYEPLTREEFGTNFEMMLQEIRGLEFTGEEEGFIIRLYYKGNDILKVDMLSEDYNTKVFEFTKVNSKNSGYYKFYDGTMVYEDKVTTIDKVTTHALTVDYINYETGEVDEGYGSEITITIDNTKKNEQSINLIEKVRLLSYDENFEELDIMSIEPTVIRNYTLKGKVDGDNNTLEVIMTDGDDIFTSTLSIIANIKENAEFEYVTVNDGFNVENATDDEITGKKAQIIENWNNTIGKDSTKVQQFETAVSMYLSMFMPVEEYEEGLYAEEDIDWSSLELE